ncbi:cysteine desulfurase/selenocysteine lyase [Prosthecobacter fusiformis]|uniref:Cysteine desulfurase n=1 Tax=Prosthecobacter fusiformis TaxID=48464 RepID=A0A4R7RKF9_9BACT|nr:cysteine desulfurase [Prosthecobacter fusiformis]TDU63123.1 cysteine desulfurase/selenocysteine lyase [Prosthecobacter fusiformis]
MDWPQLRADFPILNQEVHGHPLVYFDNAASSQKPRQVIDALVHYYQHDHANVHRGLHELSMRATDAFEATRKKVARFIGAAREEEIIYTRGTTEGINLVAQVWSAQYLKPGDIILLTGMEHHSNLVPWQLAAKRSGAILQHIPVLEDGTLDLDTAATLLTDQVKVFACVHISNSLGTINPVKDLCAKARALGAMTLVDGAQAVGHLPVNVQDIGCDFYAFSGHKMCAPTGIGALYGRYELLEKMDPWHGGGEMITTVTLDTSSYKAPPAKFEAGTPNIADVIGLGTAIDYLESIGLENIQAHGNQLTTYAYDQMQALPGIRILGPRQPRASLIAFALDCAHPHDLVEFANTYGLALRGGHHCTQPLMKRFKLPGTSRASFYFYNTHAEVDQMMNILHQAVKFFS